VAVGEQLANNIRLADVAALSGCSASYFSRKFHATVGITFRRYLLQARLATAMKLLSESDLPLRDVASACGFTEQSGLSHAFRRNVGVSPFKWRAANRR
jgi:AraC family transcriptional regulator